MSAVVHVAEYVVFAVLMISNLAVGLIFAFRGRALNSNTEETFLGSRTLGILPLSMSILASLVTAIGLVGFTAHFYTHGLHLLWGTIPALFLMPFISRVIVPVIYKLGVTSVFEYLRMRFGNKVGITACSLYFILNG
uniref:Putative solute carrier family 5 sodium/glucose cotransporter member 12 n=1 Tax=Ixodes ricinus TaxID=34613 RepID=V5GKH2_IXORI